MFVPSLAQHLASLAYSPSDLSYKQYDSDEDDLAVFSPGAPPSRSPASPYNSNSQQHQQQHYASNVDPFSNSSAGAYDSFQQNQNTGAYGGGEMIGMGTAGGSTGRGSGGQARYDDTYEPY